ncbi:MAG: DinB family protein [Ignavibacteriales bacterium]|nr:DinB family protein [Ignavibacteriales bacterium]
MPLNQSQTTRLATQLEGLKLLRSAFDNAALQKRPSNGKWTAHEQICHIGRAQDIFFDRFERIITERMPPKIDRYNAEEDKEWTTFLQKTTDAAIDYTVRKRKELNEYLSQVREGDLRKRGIHSAFGELTLDMWVEFFLVHEAHHLYSIVKLLQPR